MRVLVTGGAGFIGSHIVDLLIENHFDVCIIDNLINGQLANLNDKATFYKIDIRDKNLDQIIEKEKPDCIVHCAAQISVQSSIDNPLNDADINILGTLNLLETAKKYNVKRIIYSSSAAIFGEPLYLPIDEKHPLNMQSGYGVSKHTVEHYLDVYNKLYGIEYVILRYSNVYGPRQISSCEGGVISILCDKILNDIQPNIYGDGNQTRDFIFVKDVANANLLAISSKKNSLYNVCTNTNISINDLIRYINLILNKNITPIFCSIRKGDIMHSLMTNDSVIKELGWIPKYEMQDGLKETLNFYKCYFRYTGQSEGA